MKKTEEYEELQRSQNENKNCDPNWKINEYKISKVFNITKKSNQWKLAQGGTKLHPILNTWTGG